MEKLRWKFSYIKEEYKKVRELGYTFITCEEYFNKKHSLPKNVVVNRVDIDFSLKKTEVLLEIFEELGIKASFFLRLHAPEYNPFSFEGYRIIKRIIANGHELGYHSEIVDQAEIWSEDPLQCLKRDIAIIETGFDIKVKGIASHGGNTGLNNLDFWKNTRAKDLGFLYEAYDHEPEFNLFQEAFYVSDSEWTQWKCYDKGTLRVEDRRSLSEHAQDKHPLMHFLIHPDTYYFRHIYE